VVELEEVVDGRGGERLAAVLAPGGGRLVLLGRGDKVPPALEEVGVDDRDVSYQSSARGM
jgi:hypothetical protein